MNIVCITMRLHVTHCFVAKSKITVQLCISDMIVSGSQISQK